jgi:hypothetical protein
MQLNAENACINRMWQQSLKHEIIDFDRNALKSSERPGTNVIKENLVLQKTS